MSYQLLSYIYTYITLNIFRKDGAEQTEFIFHGITSSNYGSKTFYFFDSQIPNTLSDIY